MRRPLSKRQNVTLVLRIRAASAPTPPLSPADMPSTSSMIRHDLSVITTPAAFVRWGMIDVSTKEGRSDPST